MKWFALPTWLIAFVVVSTIPFHTWKGLDGKFVFTLQEWHDGATTITSVIDASMWFCLGLSIRMLIQ